MTTSSIPTYRVSGLPGLAVRLGHALEHWGAEAARPLDRCELERLNAERLEARAALAERDAASYGVYRLG